MDVKVEPIIRLLTALLIFLVVCLFISEIFFKDDSQFFQAVSSMGSGVLGALLGIITGRGKSQDTYVASEQRFVQPRPEPAKPAEDVVK